MGRLHRKQSAQSRTHLSFCSRGPHATGLTCALRLGPLAFFQAPVNDTCLSPPVPANYKDFLARPAALGQQPESPHGAPGARRPTTTSWPSGHFSAFKAPPADNSMDWT